MPAGPTYEPIATTTISGSAVSSVSFSSISSTYTDLILIASIKCNTSDTNIKTRLNTDTGSNYSVTYVAGTGSATESGRASNQTSIDTAYQDGDTWGNIIYYFNNYSNTTTNKTVISRSSNAGNFVAAYVGLWRNTAAVNAIELFSSSANIAVGSTFTLYGIASA
jgi:hypothetical protein